MKQNKGIAGIGIILIIIAVIAIGGIAYYMGTTSSSAPASPYATPSPTTTTGPTTATTPTSTTATAPTTASSSCLPTDPASLHLTYPTGGETFTVGQQITITWTKCNIQNIYLGSMSGAHDNGLFSEAPISAASGSYNWTIPSNLMGSVQGVNNSFHVGIQSADSASNTIQDISGAFTIN